MSMDINMYKKLGLFTVIMLLFIVNLLGCQLFDASEQIRKIDSKEGRKELPEDAYDIDQVAPQKRKDLLASYKLEGGLKQLQSLNIIKTAHIKENKIEVNFLLKEMENNKKEKSPKEKVVWENVLFLYYTIYDTFPDITEIELTADYYFLDQYGNPYKERVFISHMKREQLKLINRDYLQPEMVAGLADFYMSEYLTPKQTKAEK